MDPAYYGLESKSILSRGLIRHTLYSAYYSHTRIRHPT